MLPRLNSSTKSLLYGALALPPPAKTWLTTMVDEALQAAGAPTSAMSSARNVRARLRGGKTISSSGGGCTDRVLGLRGRHGHDGRPHGGTLPQRSLLRAGSRRRRATKIVEHDGDRTTEAAGDVQWHTTDNHTDHARDPGRRRRGRWLTPGATSRHQRLLAGRLRVQVCRAGRPATGRGRAPGTSVDVTDDDGFHIERLVAVESHITDNGDSGGPWFLVFDAGGIHDGGTRARRSSARCSRGSRTRQRAPPGIGLRDDRDRAAGRPAAVPRPRSASRLRRIRAGRSRLRRVAGRRGRSAGNGHAGRSGRAMVLASRPDAVGLAPARPRRARCRQRTSSARAPPTAAALASSSSSALSRNPTMRVSYTRGNRPERASAAVSLRAPQTLRSGRPRAGRPGCLRIGPDPARP